MKYSHVEIPAPTIVTIFLNPPFFQHLTTPSKSNVSRILTSSGWVVSFKFSFSVKYCRIFSKEESSLSPEGVSDLLHPTAAFSSGSFFGELESGIEKLLINIVFCCEFKEL